MPKHYDTNVFYRVGDTKLYQCVKNTERADKIPGGWTHLYDLVDSEYYVLRDIVIWTKDHESVGKLEPPFGVYKPHNNGIWTIRQQAPLYNIQPFAHEAFKELENTKSKRK